MENKNENDSEEEEEVIVYANFEEGTVSPDIFQQPDVKFKVIGLDSDTPIVQLGETTFKGSWNDTIGTRVFFEEDPSPEQADPVFTVLPPKMLKYKCMSTKTLDLSRIFLKPKTTEDQVRDVYEETLAEPEHSIFEQENEIMELVENTVKPNQETDTVMSDIVMQSVMEVVD